MFEQRKPAQSMAHRNNESKPPHLVTDEKAMVLS